MTEVLLCVLGLSSNWPLLIVVAVVVSVVSFVGIGVLVVFIVVSSLNPFWGRYIAQSKPSSSLIQLATLLPSFFKKEIV